MKKLRIRIVDLIHNAPSQSLYRRVMFPSYVSVMPQVVGVWCRQEGHDVDYRIFTGPQNLKSLMTDDTDLVFISSFTFTAQLAYALSHFYRSRGIPTVLGGPHARSYPDDACLYFDYVLGLTDRKIVRELLPDAALNAPSGVYLTACTQPSSLPGLRERWDFIDQVHRQMSVLKTVSILGSFGCPYDCEFCIDAEIPYQTLDTDVIKEDLRFVMARMKRPLVGWFDPNFGVAFDTLMDTIESTVPPGKVDFFAECTLSVLSEPRVERLTRNGFRMIMPGIESWFDYGRKSRTGARVGMDKVREVADHVNMVQRHIPQVQTNFMFGLDSDAGDEPFTLTKHFIDLAPAVYPSFSLLSAFGRGAKGNVRYEREGRVIPFPFHMLRSTYVLNVVPKHYTWEALYGHYLEVLRHCFSPGAMSRRFHANPLAVPRWVTLLLSLTIGGKGKIRSLTRMLEQLRREPEFRSLVTRASDRIPAFMVEQVRRDLGPLWDWLPAKSLSYTVNVLSAGRGVTE